MKKENYFFEIEQKIFEELFLVLQGNMIMSIINDAEKNINKNDNCCRFCENAFLINDNISKDLVKVFNKVKKTLDFDEPINFYIKNSPELNIRVFHSFNKNEPHAFIIDSSLLNFIDEKELPFIIGKHIGHLINKNAVLDRIIKLVFKDDSAIPPLLYNKIKIFRQLSELASDRYGYTVCKSSETILSVIYKTSYGIHSKGFSLDKKAIFNENQSTFNAILKKGYFNYTQYPVCPIRIKHIEILENLFENKNDDIKNFIDKLFYIKNSEYDYNLLQYIASGGILIAESDGDFDPKEYEKIIIKLSKHTYIPKTQLEAMINKEDNFVVFNESLLKILNHDSSQKVNLLSYLMDVAVADNKILDSEVRLIYEIGEKLMGYTKHEIAAIFLDVIRNNFYPNVCKL